MLISMTGFSTKSITIKKPTGEPLQLTIMLKSLNARFFEATCKLPFALTHLETEIIKHLKNALIRGTVYVTIQAGTPGTLKASVVPAYDVVEGYIDALTSMQKRFNIAGALQLHDIIQLPNIFEFPEELINKEMGEDILAAIDELARELTQARSIEGAALENDIVQRIALMHNILESLKARAFLVAAQRREYLIAQIKSLMAETQTDLRDQQVQLFQSQLDRYDVTEETVRFAAHLENLQVTLKAPGYEKGKKIDFILQELFREINTLAAKANDSEMGQLAIAVKVELEKIREQAQNVI